MPNPSYVCVSQPTAWVASCNLHSHVAWDHLMVSTVTLVLLHTEASLGVWAFLCVLRMVSCNLFWFTVRMTQLSIIPQHHITLYCECGHDKTFSVQDLLDRLRPDTTVHEVADRARCTHCRRQGDKHVRLFWKYG